MSEGRRRQYTVQLEPWEAAFELGQIADQIKAVADRFAHIFPKLAPTVVARIGELADVDFSDIGNSLGRLSDALQDEYEAATKGDSK